MMADSIMGMFATPQEIRQKQIDAERAAYDKAMLSGDAFMQGQAMGRRIGGSFGGMMGITSPEEQKAAQIQDMASNLNLETPQGLALFARMLNNQGMTEEAMKVFELAKAREESELNRQVKEKSLKDRNIKVINSYYDPLKGVTVNEYGYWDPELGKVVKLSPSEAAAVEGQEGDVKIGTTAESLQESWGG